MPWDPIGPKADNIYIRKNKLLQMVLKSIYNPDVGLCSFGL